MMENPLRGVAHGRLSLWATVRVYPGAALPAGPYRIEDALVQQSSAAAAAINRAAETARHAPPPARVVPHPAAASSSSPATHAATASSPLGAATGSGPTSSAAADCAAAALSGPTCSAAAGGAAAAASAESQTAAVATWRYFPVAALPVLARCLGTPQFVPHITLLGGDLPSSLTGERVYDIVRDVLYKGCSTSVAPPDGGQAVAVASATHCMQQDKAATEAAAPRAAAGKAGGEAVAAPAAASIPAGEGARTGEGGATAVVGGAEKVMMLSQIKDDSSEPPARAQKTAAGEAAGAGEAVAAAPASAEASVKENEGFLSFVAADGDATLITPFFVRLDEVVAGTTPSPFQCIYARVRQLLSAEAQQQVHPRDTQSSHLARSPSASQCSRTYASTGEPSTAAASPTTASSLPSSAPIAASAAAALAAGPFANENIFNEALLYILHRRLRKALFDDFGAVYKEGSGYYMPHVSLVYAHPTQLNSQQRCAVVRALHAATGATAFPQQKHRQAASRQAAATAAAAAATEAAATAMEAAAAAPTDVAAAAAATETGSTEVRGSVVAAVEKGAAAERAGRTAVAEEREGKVLSTERMTTDENDTLPSPQAWRGELEEAGEEDEEEKEGRERAKEVQTRVTSGGEGSTGPSKRRKRKRSLVPNIVRSGSEAVSSRTTADSINSCTASGKDRQSCSSLSTTSRGSEDSSSSGSNRIGSTSGRMEDSRAVRPSSTDPSSSSGKSSSNGSTSSGSCGGVTEKESLFTQLDRYVPFSAAWESCLTHIAREYMAGLSHTVLYVESVEVVETDLSNIEDASKWKILASIPLPLPYHPACV